MDGGWEIKNVKIEKGLLTFDVDTNERDLKEVKMDIDLYPDIWGQIAKVKNVKENIDRYAAEFNRAEHMYLELYEYTKNKVILDYFSSNPLVITKVPVKNHF